MVPPAKRTLLKHTLWMCTAGLGTMRSSIPNAWRPLLMQPSKHGMITWLYGASSFLYTLVGMQALIMFYVCPEAVPEWPQRVALVESGLVSMQGVWSFCSDVVNVGIPSRFHMIDRVTAISLMALQFLKYGVLVRPSLSLLEIAWIWLGLAVSVRCKLGGYQAILRNEAESYRAWHIAWHVSLPVVFGCFHAVRWHASAEADKCSSSWSLLVRSGMPLS
jgi:hypothetical protein